MTFQKIQNLASELQQIKDEQAFVLKKYQEKISSIEDNLHSIFLTKFNKNYLANQTYILNRPHKWGELTNLKVHSISTSQLFQDNGQFIPYYKKISLLDFHQTLNFINQFQELPVDFFKDPNFDTFFNSENHFLILTAPDYEFEESDSYIYEYVIISLAPDLI